MKEIDSIKLPWAMLESPQGRTREEAAKCFLDLPHMWEEHIDSIRFDLANCKASVFEARRAPLNGDTILNTKDWWNHGIDRQIVRKEAIENNLRWSESQLPVIRRVVNWALAQIVDPQIAEALRLTHLERLTAPEVGRRLGRCDRTVRRLKAKGYRLLPIPDTGKIAKLA